MRWLLEVVLEKRNPALQQYVVEVLLQVVPITIHYETLADILPFFPLLKPQASFPLGEKLASYFGSMRHFKKMKHRCEKNTFGITS